MRRRLNLEKAIKISNIALKRNALIPLNTDLILEKNQQFQLRKLNFKVLKLEDIIGPKPNPFSPWDKDLEVTCISNSHILLLNKYPVELGHMLLISRNFKCQNGWIDLDDWESVCSVNLDTTGLWFFNSCKKAGASQPHRHLQLLPREINQPLCPRENWFEQALSTTKNKTKLDKSILTLPIIKSNGQLTADSFYNTYLNLCSKLEIGNPVDQIMPSIPYNLIFTDNWMSLIRRSKEKYKGFSINALGFAGYFLSTRNSNIPWFETNGPEKLLSEVVMPI